MAISKRRLGILAFLGLGAAGVILFVVKVSSDIDIDRQVVSALQSTNQFGEITPDGVEVLRRVDQRAIPVLLRWSEGRDPRWYKLVSPLRRLLKMPALYGTFWAKKEMARRGFAVLRARGTPAV